MERNSLWKKLAIPLVLIIGIATLTIFTSRDDAPSSGNDGEQLTQIKFNMSWLPQGSMAGIFVAIDKGYYKDVGLEVEPIRGFGGTRTVNELDQGMFEFAYADPLSVTLNRFNGGHAKMIGGVNMKFPAGACFIKERHNIKTPSDLAGLSFGAGQSSAVQKLLPSWLKRNNVDAQKVKMIQLDPSVVVSSLIEGRVDTAECWQGNSMALFEKNAAIAGLTVGRLPYADFGFDVYGSGFVARDEYIASHPDIVKKFLEASYRGYDDAAASPEDAVKIIRKYHELLEPAVTEQQIRETAGLMAAGGGSKALDRAKIERTISFLTDAGQIKDFDKADSVFTNQFLNSQPDK